MMMPSGLIVADNVTVEFPVFDLRSRSLRHFLFLNRIPLRPMGQALGGSKHVGGAIGEGSGGTIVVKALDRISFTFTKGERIGLIGHNGCGKTTLLRTLAGIYEPVSGRLDTHGRVMPLFNLTEGMAPDATGRELVFVRGILLGLSPTEITDLIPEILDFCELGDYIDMPVRTYSTGMLVRLAFAVTTAVSSEILLFDELIGAGDAHFVDKAQQRLERFVERSNLVVIASHARDILYKWCTRAILLEHGKIIADGDVGDTLKTYDERLASQ